MIKGILVAGNHRMAMDYIREHGDHPREWIVASDWHHVVGMRDIPVVFGDKWYLNPLCRNIWDAHLINHIQRYGGDDAREILRMEIATIDRVCHVLPPNGVDG